MKASKIAAVDFFDDLSSPFARKRFFWGFVLLCLACGVVLYVLAQIPPGWWRDVVYEVFVHLLSDCLLIIAFYFLYLYFIGPNEGLREVQVTRPRDIRGRLEALPTSTTSYMFWGRSGTYFRNHPLKTLDEQSRSKKLKTDVEVLLPDPDDKRLITLYRRILDSLGEKREGNPLLANVLATSIACAIVDANNSYVRVRLCYSKFLPASRVDLSDSGALMTQDDPAKSALFFESSSEFYEMLRTTIRNEMEVSREVKWDRKLFSGKALRAEDIDTEVLTAFGLSIPDVDQMRAQVVELITNPRDRYK